MKLRIFLKSAHNGIFGGEDGCEEEHGTREGPAVARSVRTSSPMAPTRALHPIPASPCHYISIGPSPTVVSNMQMFMADLFCEGKWHGVGGGDVGSDRI